MFFMKIFKFLIILLLFISNTYFATCQNDTLSLSNIRKLFYQSVESESKLDILKQSIKLFFGEKKDNYPPIGLAYYGASLTLEAKHSYNPISKINRLKEGLNFLDKSVKSDNNNLEIRFLRFSVLHHLPDILGYGKEKREDADTIYKLLINQDFSNLSYDLQRGIANFLINSKRISKEQITKLNLIYNK